MYVRHGSIYRICPSATSFGRVGTSPRSQSPSAGRISNDVDLESGTVWICHGSTHLGSVDEYLDEFLDTGRRLEDGVPLEELFSRGTYGSALFPNDTTSGYKGDTVGRAHLNQSSQLARSHRQHSSRPSSSSGFPAGQTLGPHAASLPGRRSPAGTGRGQPADRASPGIGRYQGRIFVRCRERRSAEIVADKWG